MGRVLPYPPDSEVLLLPRQYGPAAGEQAVKTREFVVGGEACSGGTSAPRWAAA